MDEPVKGDQLKSIVERIERLEEEKKTISDDIKEVYAEAKGNGYDVKVLRKVIAIRKRDANERAEEEAILDLYLQAVGESANLLFTGAPQPLVGSYHDRFVLTPEGWLRVSIGTPDEMAAFRTALTQVTGQTTPQAPKETT